LFLFPPWRSSFLPVLSLSLSFWADIELCSSGNDTLAGYISYHIDFTTCAVCCAVWPPLFFRLPTLPAISA
jgi:hypothetical protein